jgi:hypothetical protein
MEAKCFKLFTLIPGLGRLGISATFLRAFTAWHLGAKLKRFLKQLDKIGR